MNPNQASSETLKQPFLVKIKKNLAFRSKWGELNGSMGDLGTFIPIILALTLAKDLDLGTTLIFTGIYNFATGALYGIPMPVQPMKAISSVAISSGPDFGVPEVMFAGIWTGVILMFLGVTGLMEFVYRFIPLSVVRGVQLSQGLNFAMTGIKYVRNVQNFKTNKSGGDRPWLGLDGLILALVCACFIIIVNGSGEENEENEANDGGERKKSKWKRFLFSLPSAFMVFLLGLAFAIVRRPKVLSEMKFGPSRIHLLKISKHAMKEGFLRGTIPQLPLSILNSVIAVCKLSSDLFPGRRFTSTSLSVTVGVMNLVGCWFGAVPCCHGAGGLAGQYKFGGRSGGCVALLGIAKLVLGLVLGSSIVKVLDQFPVGVLGVLLLFAGIELAMAARDMNSKDETFVMLVCASVSLVGSGASVGFVCGIVIYLLLKLRKVQKNESCSNVWN
ncbi:Molybdate transporter 1/2 [Dillenia turbinata]|uniref:Molybdate transporter 1/2 n=1 Tax=Dillenia turbinata TaxID=194707 RepID=A0AAN8V4L7_9MAGN